jgi:uncharacterized BrkB/YihY/UPF0761 family membrane protein
VPLLAAGVAFYALLSLFPAIIAAVSIYGLVALVADPDTERAAYLEEINPGNMVNGTLVFDVPKNANRSGSNCMTAPLAGGTVNL